MGARDTTDRNKAVLDSLKPVNKKLIEPKKRVGRRIVSPQLKRSEQVCLYITPTEMEQLNREADREMCKPSHLIYKFLKQKGFFPEE